MIDVTVRRDSQERLSSLFVSGHAEWEEAGQDVVCAAVSAIVQAAWLGVERVARVPVDAKKSEGRLSLRWSGAQRGNKALQNIVETAELAISQIARQYPDHVRLSRETETSAP